MGVRTGVRCCGEVMAGGRGSAILLVSCFFLLLEIFAARADSGLCDRDYMVGFLDAWWRWFEARKFEDEVASGENWNFEPLGELTTRLPLSYRNTCN